MCGVETPLNKGGAVKEKCTTLCDKICRDAWAVQQGFFIADLLLAYRSHNVEQIKASIRQAWKQRSAQRHANKKPSYNE